MRSNFVRNLHNADIYQKNIDFANEMMKRLLQPTNERGIALRNIIFRNKWMHIEGNSPLKQEVDRSLSESTYQKDIETFLQQNPDTNGSQQAQTHPVFQSLGFKRSENSASNWKQSSSAQVLTANPFRVPGFKELSTLSPYTQSLLESLDTPSIRNLLNSGEKDEERNLRRFALLWQEMSTQPHHFSGVFRKLHEFALFAATRKVVAQGETYVCNIARELLKTLFGVGAFEVLSRIDVGPKQLFDDLQFGYAALADEAVFHRQHFRLEEVFSGPAIDPRWTLGSSRATDLVYYRLVHLATEVSCCECKLIDEHYKLQSNDPKSQPIAEALAMAITNFATDLDFCKTFQGLGFQECRIPKEYEGRVLVVQNTRARILRISVPTRLIVGYLLSNDLQEIRNNMQVTEWNNNGEGYSLLKYQDFKDLVTDLLVVRGITELMAHHNLRCLASAPVAALLELTPNLLPQK